ncbi:MAG TPA: hypothetical protein VEK57_30925 [Thermoanaerobaculia bacterium]|nr:hypothetical protein [Thermoanaerobaculia bacterium]
MTIFRALPVAQGDAFLLTTSEARAYLVDGGRRRAGVPSMPMQLAASGVRYLDAAIVTHTDRDHVEGIEDLIHGRFPVSEYWLPANWLDTIRLARRFGGDWQTWVAAVDEILRQRRLVTPDGGETRRRRRSDDERRDRNDDHALTADLALGGIATSALALATTKLEESTSSESFNHHRDTLLDRAAEILERGEKEDEARVAGIPWYFDEHPSLPNRSISGGIAATLSRVATAAVEGVRSDAAELTRTLATIGSGSTSLAMARSHYFPDRWHPRVRFFDYSGAVVDHAVAGHPMMICVNGTEVTEPIEMPHAVGFELVTMVTRVATLSRINRESRVFRFNDGASEVLFCGDSALAFTDNPITLGLPAIVTAPHHGALANAKAYARIRGGRLTWVRSDEQNTTKRPCAHYVALPRKYCTTCGGSPTCVELVFDHAAGNWKTDAAPCRCTAKAATYAMPSWSGRLSTSR